MTEHETCVICGASIPPPPPAGAVDPRTGASLDDPNWEPTACPKCQPAAEHHPRRSIEFRPSSASRWMACPASIRLGAGRPTSPTSPEAAEGVRAHTLAAVAATLGPDRWRAMQPMEGWPADMIEAATFWTDMLHRWSISDDVRVEQRLVLRPPPGFDLPLIRGTADAVAVSQSGDHGLVADLKFGRGIFVPAVGNIQLMIYGAALLQAEPSIKRIELLIYQPRFGDDVLRSVEFGRPELERRAGEILIGAQRWRNAEAQPGEHCRWCPAIARCEKAQKVAAALSAEGRRRLDASEADEATEDDVDGLAAWLSDHQGTVRAVLRAAELKLTGEIEEGVDVPGWTLTQGWSPRKWKPGVTADDLIEIGFDPTANPPMPTPTQVERAIRGGRKSIEKLVHRTRTRPRLEQVIFNRE